MPLPVSLVLCLLCWGVTQSAEGTEPKVLISPPHQAIRTGTEAKFEAILNTPFFQPLQWFHNGIAVPDATNRTLVIKEVNSRDGGAYAVRIERNDADPIIAEAELTVCWNVELWSLATNVAPALAKFDHAGNQYVLRQEKSIVVGYSTPVITNFIFAKANQEGVPIWRGEYAPESKSYFWGTGWTIASDGGMYFAASGMEMNDSSDEVRPVCLIVRISPAGEV